MIYATEGRANQIANMLNERRGHPYAMAVRTGAGWTVIASYAYGTTTNPYLRVLGHA